MGEFPSLLTSGAASACVTSTANPDDLHRRDPERPVPLVGEPLAAGGRHRRDDCAGVGGSAKSSACATIRRAGSRSRRAPTTGRWVRRGGICRSDEPPCRSCAGRLSAACYVRSPKTRPEARDGGQSTIGCSWTHARPWPAPPAFGGRLPRQRSRCGCRSSPRRRAGAGTARITPASFARTCTTATSPRRSRCPSASSSTSSCSAFSTRTR